MRERERDRERAKERVTIVEKQSAISLLHPILVLQVLEKKPAPRHTHIHNYKNYLFCLTLILTPPPPLFFHTHTHTHNLQHREQKGDKRMPGLSCLSVHSINREYFEMHASCEPTMVAPVRVERWEKTRNW